MIKADNGGKDAIRVTPEFDSSYDGVSGEKVVYTSSNPDIIEVDNTGKITTKGASDEVSDHHGYRSGQRTEERFFS